MLSTSKSIGKKIVVNYRYNIIVLINVCVFFSGHRSDRAAHIRIFKKESDRKAPVGLRRINAFHISTWQSTAKW